MKLFSVSPAKPFHLLAALAASAALMGCVGARNGAGNGAPPSATDTKAMPVEAQARSLASFGAVEIAPFTPSIAQDARGNRIAVWEEFDGQRFNIWAKRSIAGLGWGGSRQLSAQHGGNAYNPRIAFDTQGNAMAVWEQQLGGHYKVWANRYVAGQGWGTAHAIDSIPSTTPSDAYAPQVALNAVGEAVAVWQQTDGQHAHVHTSRFLPVGGWGAATSIGSATTHASAPQIAFDARGIALVVWQQFDGQQTQVWASQQTAGGNWAPAAQLGIRAGVGDSLNTSITVDTQGAVTALWQQVDGASSAIWARHYSASLGWGRPTLVEPHYQAQDADSAPLPTQAGGESVVAARWPMLRNKTQPTP
jgi:hypothetical protein